MFEKKGKAINEETKRKMKILRNILILIGLPLLITGIVLISDGYANFFGGGIGEFNKIGAGMFTAFFGFTLIIISISLTMLIHRREITKYIIEEGGMALGSADEEALDGYGRIISKGSEAVVKGFKNAGGINFSSDNKPTDKIMIKCRECGTLNDENAQFCDRCGKQI